MKPKSASFSANISNKGSDGLKAFMRGRIQSALNLVETIEAHPLYYASIRPSTLRLTEMEAFISSFIGNFL